MTRDINLVDKFSIVTNRFDQQKLCLSVQALTRQALVVGFEIDDIIACLAYMVEVEAEVSADVYARDMEDGIPD